MRRTRLIAAILLAVIPGACTGYQTVADPEAGLGASPMQLDQARVTPWIGERFQLTSPEIFGDSLRGFLADGTVRTVGLVDVKKFEMRTVDPERTMTLISVVVCAVGFALAKATTCTPDEEE
jgi:hypothetical protein